MRLDRAFHLLNALLALTAVAAMETASRSAVFLLGTLAVCAIYLRMETRERPRHLPAPAATAITLLAFLVIMGRFFGTTEEAVADILEFRVPLIARFLIVAQWAMLLRRRTNRDYAWLYLISLALLAGSALLMPDLPFACFYGVFVVLGIAVLRVYVTRLDLEMVGQTLEEASWRLDGRFALRCAAGALALMLPVAFFFAALPRGRPGALGATSRRAPKPVSGFAEAVQLGQMGRIQQSSSRVMQVRVTDLAGNVLRAPNLLLRGAAFDVYEKGRWRATQTRSAKDYRVAGNQPLVFPTPPDMEASVHQQAPLIHCDVSLEPLDTRVLFTPYPVESLTLPYNTAITVDRLHETMQTRYERRGVLRYQVVSRMAATRLPPGLRMPSPPPPAQSLWIQLPTDFPDRVRRLAERVADVGHGAPPYDRARRILEFLSDPRAFKYSLELRPIPEGEDPVEGFLFGTREGNCEYFASAMVLLLRCAGVRARMVNGYKTGEWNEFGQHVTFRQRDAHSWAEAYIPGFGWATFDPSPGEGERPLRHAEGVLEKLRSLADLVERAWIEYVVSYDEDKQGVFYHYLQRPLILVKNVLAAALWQLLGPEWLSRGRMEEMWSTIWGRTRGPVTVAASVVAAAMVIQSLRQALRWRTRRRSARVSVAFYGEMLRVLRRKGFRRRPHVTPAEFADEVLTADAEALAPVGLLTRLFCEVRYGGRDLDTDQQTEIGLALKRLRRARPRRRRSATIKAPTAP